MKLRKIVALTLAAVLAAPSFISLSSLKAEAASPVVVVLDPGHGGSDVGAVSVAGTYEKDMALKISQYTKTALEKYPNVKVYMTRSTNEYVGLTERTERAKEYGADIFVSQHLNSSTNVEASGAEVYVSHLDQYYSSLKVFGDLVIKQLTGLGLPSRGVKTRLSSNGSIHEATGEVADYYAVIAASANRDIPAVIIEHAFVSNQSDYDGFLNTDDKLKALGEADAKAIAEYYGLTGSVQSGVNVSYQTHIQNVGWQGVVYNGATSGTTGRNLRLEAIKINITGDNRLGVEYSTHVQNIGWQDWMQNGNLAGTEGRNLRLEGIRIRLTGANAANYDIYYRVHSQDYGWLDWAKNGQVAGTIGYEKRLESIEIKLVPKGQGAPGSTYRPYVSRPAEVTYQSYVEGKGWLPSASNGSTSGTIGEGLRLEAIKISLENTLARGSVSYRAHMENSGWQDFVSGGEVSGKPGENRRLEAIEIRLTGEMAELYDIYYRVHSQQLGWLDWAANGEPAGTAGYGFRVEGIEIKLVAKGSDAPGTTARPYVEKPAEPKTPPTAENTESETKAPAAPADTAGGTESGSNSSNFAGPNPNNAGNETGPSSPANP